MTTAGNTRTLAEIRKEHRVYQAELAKEIGIARGTYARWEKYTPGKFTAEHIHIIAEVLGESPEAIFLACL